MPYGDNTSCADECGVPNGDNTSCADCAGTPNGSAYVDECDICNDDPSDDCVQDCDGVWGGSAVEDTCGVCGGDDSSCNQPLASSASVTVEEDSSVDFALTVSDPNGDALTVNIVYGPDRGDATINGINVTYTPDDNFFGVDEFGYLSLIHI